VKTYVIVTFAAGVALATPMLLAQERTQAQEHVYGSQLMTPQERDQYRAKMRSLTTEQEREQLRQQHHKAMQQRAKERGMTLPDEPPARGHGMGSGMGQGMGPNGGQGMGGGMGPGGGQGQQRGR